MTFGNGLPMSLRAARTLAGRGVHVRVLDLRWLRPLPVDDLLAAAAATGRVASEDSFVPLGAAAELVLLDQATVEAAALALLDA